MSTRKLKKKQDEKLRNKPLEEKMKAAARLAALEMRNTDDLKEPDQLASGKSDDKGNMILEDNTDDD